MQGPSVDIDTVSVAEMDAEGTHKAYELCYDACNTSRLRYNPLRTLTSEMTVKIRKNLTIHTRKRA